MSDLQASVREFWEAEPCGTGDEIVGDRRQLTREWFEQVEEHRYRVEPFIHSVAQFTRHYGKQVLEVGVGAGTDHLQWARAGARLTGVDLTQAAIDTTRARFEMYGFVSDLRRIDAERLPFDDERFDLVYSWGVVHHSEHPETVVAEIHRVLRVGGEFRGMIYGRHSVLALKLWARHALAKARPFRSLTDVVAHHMESPGTQAYTIEEARRLFGAFASVEVTPLMTTYDTSRIPRVLTRFFPQQWGWFLAIRAVR